MTGVAAPAARRYAGGGAETVGFALVAYLPFLLSSRGKVSGDNNSYLYLDPGRFLGRVPSMWDPHVGAGTVSHQHLGYLFPIGPYYWVMQQLGFSDWVAQRLWWGTISFAAGLGALWLFRLLGARHAGAIAGALIYMLTPYQLAFTARISLILLPWAGLPWLVGLTIRSVRRGGWRDPALFALVMFAIGGVNASALLLASVAPATWLALEMLRGRTAAMTTLRAAGRIAVLTLGVSLWWAVGLRIQGAYGLPVLQLTESLHVVTRSSNPLDLLRGLGNWFFYGFDRLGPSIDQSKDYLSDFWVVGLSFAVPAIALVAAAVIRWRHRAYFVVLVLVGTVVGVGAWPFHHPSWYGQLFKAFANGTSLGLALRNTPRVAPVIVLGLAGLFAGGVAALASRRTEVIAAVVVGALAAAVLIPVWRVGFLSRHLERPEEIPSYWREAAAALEREGQATRVLEIPGSNFAAYRWGNIVEPPVTPTLIDRPFIAREVLPFGSPPSVNLLDALDHRIQEGTFEPASLAPYARLFGIGTVVVRSDLEFERFNTPRPRLLWMQLTQPLPPGISTPRGFGEPVRNAASAAVPIRDELELTIPATAPDPPPVALLDVAQPVPIVHTAPSARPVVLAGDGEGIVDAAAAGLLDGKQLVLESAALSRAQLRQALGAGADLVLTDSNRRRSESFFASIRDTTGPTERAAQKSADPDEDFRLDVFPGAGDAARTVVEQHGGRADATAALAQDRPANAFDHDLRTAWRVAGPHPERKRLVLTAAHPIRLDQVTLVQPQVGIRDRYITKARLHFDHGASQTVTFGPDALSPEGTVVHFPSRAIRRLEVEILETNRTALPLRFANPVGFAEVRVGDVQVTEAVRLPVDLVRRAAAAGHRLDIVLSRLRYEPTARDRGDEELALRRRFVIPNARAFTLTGTARVDANAPDDVLDNMLGTTAPGTTYTSSSRLRGHADARASQAFDGDPSTAWTAAVGAGLGQWLAVDLPRPITVDHIDLSVVLDGRQFVPTKVTLEADGTPARTLTVPPITGVPGGPTVHTVTIPFAPVTVQHRVRLFIDDIQDQRATTNPDEANVVLPVSIAEARLVGVPVPRAGAGVDTGCRDDLVHVNGTPVPIRVVGPATAARSGVSIQPCTGPLTLRKGSSTLVARAGLDTGIDIDRLVLSSAAGGGPATVMPRGTPLSQSGASASVVHSDATTFDLRVHTDGRPFWLVLGESHNKGWTADASSGSVGSRAVVNGFGNGWLIRPKAAGTMMVSLRWTPQNLVWAGLAISAIVVLVCLAILIATRQRRRDDDAIADVPALTSPVSYTDPPLSSWSTIAIAAIGTAVVTAAASRWWCGLAAGIGVLLGARIRWLRYGLAIGSPMVLAFSRVAEEPELAWLALALLAADLVILVLRARQRRVVTAT